MIQSLLLYYFGTDPDYKILYEETLDWGNYPATSMAVCFSVIFIVIPLVHFLQYAIFKDCISILLSRSFKTMISQKCISQYIFLLIIEHSGILLQ